MNASQAKLNQRDIFASAGTAFTCKDTAEKTPNVNAIPEQIQPNAVGQIKPHKIEIKQYTIGPQMLPAPRFFGVG